MGRFLSELCWEKAMVAYTMPQQRMKEESKRLRGEGDQIKFIDLRSDRCQVVVSGKEGDSKAFHKLHLSG